MRILFVSWRDLSHPNAGGSEVVVDKLASELARRGHHTELVCGGPASAEGPPRAYPVTVAGGTYSQYVRAPLEYRRHHRDTDLVVEVVNGMPYFSPFWRRGARLALVHHVHDDQWNHYFPRPVAAAGRTVECRVMPAVYRTTHFLTISASTRRALEAIGIAGERIHVMHSGLDPDAFTASAPRRREPTFLALARLAPNKRIDLLLELWEQVRPVTGGRLIIAGDGPELERLRRLAGPGVELTGRVSEKRKRELLASSWILVHPARQEGWGLVIMEAAAAGTPAIGFDVPGVHDTIVDGVTGELARSEQELVDRWIGLATDTDRRSRMGERAASRAREFTWDAAVDAFLKAADAALGEATTRAARAARSARPPRPPRRGAGWNRSRELVRLFRAEQSDPDAFYTFLAEDTLGHLRQFIEPEGAVAVDVGGGPGYTAEALRLAGAHCCVVEYERGELLLHDRQPEAAVQGDGQALPIASGSVDICHSSNVLEHVPEPFRMLDEMARVLKPRTGVGYVTFTNWWSPWGGHETSPWHYLGGERAARRYERRHGRPPKNRFGRSLHPLHVHQVQRWFAHRPDLEVLWQGPRYLPDSLAWTSRVPALREVVTWNLAVVFRRSS